MCRAIDYMIVDALLDANQVFHFEEKIRDPAEYVNITDDILGLIERSKDTSLAKSREILKRIRTRDLYRFLVEKMLDDYKLCQQYVSGLMIVFNDNDR